MVDDRLALAQGRRCRRRVALVLVLRLELARRRDEQRGHVALAVKIQQDDLLVEAIRLCERRRQVHSRRGLAHTALEEPHRDAPGARHWRDLDRHGPCSHM